MKVQIPKHVTWKNLDDGVVLLDLRSSKYYTLNETAGFIWMGIKDQKNIHEIAAELMNEYNCEEDECMEDIQEQLRYLENEGLITVQRQHEA